jgi:hypothetical protein
MATTAPIIVTDPSDQRLARADWPANAAGYEQYLDDPIFVVIGPEATPEAITAICERFDLDPAAAGLGMRHA